MLKLIKIAVTGGVASGKTSVCELFRELGAYVVNADSIAHKLLNPKTDLGKQVIHLIGDDVLQNGEIDRRLVAKKVFESKELLHKLEELLHPEVMQQIEQEYKKALAQEKNSIFVAEVPLLFEIGAESFFDQVISVIAEENISQKRFQALGHTEAEYKRRMGRQLSPTIKSARAHHTIFNNGSFDALKKQVEALNTLLLNNGES